MYFQRIKKPTFRKLNLVYRLLITFLIASCVPATAVPIGYPTYDPFLPIPKDSPTPNKLPTFTPRPPTATRPPTPTRAALSISLPSAVSSGQPVNTPTADVERILPTPRKNAEQYVIQPGDTLGGIAEVYGISVKDLIQANNIKDANVLDVGATLNVPAPNPGDDGTSFKVIPDSEMVYGPASVYFNIQGFIESQDGYLETYEQDVNGIKLAGYEIVYIVARNYSVNPRLLLALLEYQSGWVTNAQPFNTSYPMGFLDQYHYGLYRQMTWAADRLNQGYYIWKANAVSAWVLNDGTVIPINPTINAGTAALQYFFSQLDDRPVWEQDVSGTGLLLTYYVFFGNPFDRAIEPLISPSITQPAMSLPFKKGEAWYFTGGPHGGWDSGSAWAALDFAPSGDNGNCGTSKLWVTAVADGLVLRASNGALIQDLDNDGYEQTGWVILYMHIAQADRAAEGEYIYAGENIGHASCEGGLSNATHVHLARKYNGEWIAADGPLPYNLNGWISSGSGKEYDGYLTRGNQSIEALDGASELNQISH